MQNLPPLSTSHTWVFPTISQSVPVTRREAKAVLIGWGSAFTGDALDRALLIIGELLSNTVKHAAQLSPRASLSLSIESGRLAISVHDRDPRHPRKVSESPPDVTGGRGMEIVQHLASEAGGAVEIHSTPGAAGKTVQVFLPLCSGGQGDLGSLPHAREHAELAAPTTGRNIGGVCGP